MRWLVRCRPFRSALVNATLGNGDTLFGAAARDYAGPGLYGGITLTGFVLPPDPTNDTSADDGAGGAKRLRRRVAREGSAGSTAAGVGAADALGGEMEEEGENEFFAAQLAAISAFAQRHAVRPREGGQEGEDAAARGARGGAEGGEPQAASLALRFDYSATQSLEGCVESGLQVTAARFLPFDRT
jgi:hypothetical protein